VGDFDFVAAAVPWPASLMMLGVAIMALGLGGLLTPRAGTETAPTDP